VRKVIPYLSKKCSNFFIFGVLIFAVLNCKCDKTTGPEKPEPLEIKWQQTSLRSASNGVYSNKSYNIVFADAVDGLFSSFDNGKTWTISFEKISVTDMAFMENKDIFAFKNCYYGGMIFKSSNKGEIWEIFAAHNQPAYCPKTLIFHQSGNMFLGDLGALGFSGGNIYRSSDEGVTWQETSFPDSIGVFSMTINKNADILAGTTMGVYWSKDIGDSWQPVNDGIKMYNKKPSPITQLAHNPVNNDLIAVGRYDDIYRSTDNGNSWELKNWELQIYSSIIDILINSKGEIFLAVSSTNQGSEATRGVFYSSDNGETWQQVNNGLSDINVCDVAVDSLGFLYIATEDGIFRTVEPRYK